MGPLAFGLPYPAQVLITADRVLFDGLIDYAGLFPPTRLDMRAAVAAYTSARRGERAWILGRFICHAGRLEELAAELTVAMRPDDPPWAISVILDGDPGASAAAARAFDAEMSPAAAVELVEAPLPTEVADGRPPTACVEVIRPIVRAALSVGPRVRPYLEVPITEDWKRAVPNVVEAIAVARSAELRTLGAKIRCGGAVPEAFPTTAQVAQFILACSDNDLPFKATAGLHHPVRHMDEELGVMRHGFVNLLFAAALSTDGAEAAEIAAILSETDTSAFSVLASRLSWRGKALGLPALKMLRAERLTSYGSCSIDEPVDDLAALGMLAS